MWLICFILFLIIWRFVYYTLRSSKLFCICTDLTTTTRLFKMTCALELILNLVSTSYFDCKWSEMFSLYFHYYFILNTNWGKLESLKWRYSHCQVSLYLLTNIFVCFPRISKKLVQSVLFGLLSFTNHKENCNKVIRCLVKTCMIVHIQKRVLKKVLIELTVKFMEPIVTLLQVCSSKAGQSPLTTKLLRKRSTIFVYNKIITFYYP